MQRRLIPARPDYLARVQEAGLVYTHEDPRSDHPELYRYWRDDAYYEMTADDIVALEEASTAIFRMLQDAGDWLLSPQGAWHLQKFQIPTVAMRAVVDSWNEEPACGSILGRYDFRFGGVAHPDPGLRTPKLYEFNADTPTSLVESLVQWDWFEDNRPRFSLEPGGQTVSQWTNMYEDLIAAWKRNLALISAKIGHEPTVFFACSEVDPSHEDEMNTLVLRDTCQLAGYRVETIYIENIWLGDDGRFYAGQGGEHIDVIFKLYPWEHLAREQNADAIFADLLHSGLDRNPYSGGTIWIEPPYKMLWSNKAILPVLWHLFGKSEDGRKYLLPAWFDGDEPFSVNRTGYARKPILAREGADITLSHPSGVRIRGEEQGYGAEGFIVQELAEPPRFRRREEGVDVSTVVGVWMIDGEPSGMAVRESRGPITDNFANFLPHTVVGGPR
ncbi:glutathionylspermidine synthase family protein [Microbacterium sp. SLBN-111]|uniref:glutathionylspermidine synthase family protein n=1 Tax=Microbacterium sp. SLBN-111 TaxID=3377733 RepID=UPI003C74DFA2